MTAARLPSRQLTAEVTVRALGVSSGSSRWAGPQPPLVVDAQFREGLRRALDLGADFVDTADSHGDGHAERMIGKVLREYQGHRVHVASKIGHLCGSAPHPYAGPRIRHQLEQTLENLYQDELAVYTFDSWDFGPGDRYLECAVEQMRAMQALGQIRAIGLRGPSHGEPESTVSRFRELFCRIQPDVVWAQVNALQPAVCIESGHDLCAFTAQHGARLIIASPLAHGLLAGNRQENLPEGPVAAALERCLGSLAADFGREPGVLASLALKYLFQTAPHAVVTVGLSGTRHVEGCFASLETPLSERQMTVVRDAFAHLRIAAREAAADRSTERLRA
ncbi:aldo/keto reductase [Streptomyces sp. NPDC054796]